MLLGAYGGLRAGELFALRVPRVNFDALSVDVVETLTEVSGQLHFGPPKTKASHRRVPLPLVVIDALRQHVSRYCPEDLLRARGRSRSPRVLASTVLSAGSQGAGIAPLRVHDLWHTAVALWIAAGATPNEVASRAGHSSVSVVLDRYGHLLPGSAERVNAALDALAGRACEHEGREDRARRATASDGHTRKCAPSRTE